MQVYNSGLPRTAGSVLQGTANYRPGSVSAMFQQRQRPQQPAQQPAQQQTFQQQPLGNTNIYSPQQSQEAVNLARAQIGQQTTLPGLLEQSQRAGMGANSPYQIGRAITTGIAPGQVASQMAGVQIPFGDQEANARNRLQYEDMAAGQAIGYGNVANRISSAQRSSQLQNAQTLAGLLSRFL